MEIDNLNNTLLPISTSAGHREHDILQTISKYQHHLSKLYVGKLVSDSLANLKDKAQTEQKLYRQSLTASARYSMLVEIYDFATVLLVIAVGLGGISEIAKNKVLGYPSLIIGGLGVIILLMVSFSPLTILTLTHIPDLSHSLSPHFE